jgi:SAM-dependent methyltransferase
MVRLMAKSLEEIDADTQTYYFSAQQTGIDNRCRERMIARCLPSIPRGGHILELGFMDGQWTDHFLRLGCRITVVEGARRNIEFGRAKYRGNSAVSFVHETFERYQPADRFDCIHMGGILKHLDDPVALLQRSHAWLKPPAVLIATTPNAKSLHRRIGVCMGLLSDLEALSPTDRRIGNLRHYDIASFRDLLSVGGYGIDIIATSILKPVSSERMADWPDDLLDALDKMADELPDYGWYVYAVGRSAGASKS